MGCAELGRGGVGSKTSRPNGDPAMSPRENEIALSARVDELLHSPDRAPIVFTPGKQAAIDSLTERMAVVEEAVRELAEAVETRLAAKDPRSD